MEITISNLLKHKEELIKGISGKFQISQNGAKEFVKLAIIDWVKTNYTIQISKDILKGELKIIQKLQDEVLNWTIDEFDDEDFQVIGYCKNIR